MNPIDVQPVIIAGGSGTRLWPLSRAKRPKQFLSLASDRSLFQETLARVAAGADAPFLPPIVIGGAIHRTLIEEQAAEIGADLAAIICEPAPRNTAAAAAVAAEWTRAAHPSSLVLLTPADHHVADRAGFRASVAASAAEAAGAIVVFGVPPTTPHEGFGYIERGASVGAGVFAVAGFREKPDFATAQGFIASGRHYWNAGVFLFDPDAMLDELQRHAPAIREGSAAALARAAHDGRAILLERTAFEACPSEPLDRAVMEKTGLARVAGPFDVGWSDIGSWSAVEARAGRGEVVAIDAGTSLILSDGPLVGVIGVDDLIVVATGDAVLVVPKSRAQDVKKLVEELKARGRRDLL